MKLNIVAVKRHCCRLTRPTGRAAACYPARQIQPRPSRMNIEARRSYRRSCGPLSAAWLQWQLCISVIYTNTYCNMNLRSVIIAGFLFQDSSGVRPLLLLFMVFVEPSRLNKQEQLNIRAAAPEEPMEIKYSSG